MPAPATSAAAALIRASCEAALRAAGVPIAAQNRGNFVCQAGLNNARHIGAHTTRIDAPAKVTGTAKYSSDVQPRRLALRHDSPLANGQRPKSPASTWTRHGKMPGIKARRYRCGEGERTVRYYGEELAAVAGTSKQACLDALRAIEVEAKPLPFVVREEDAKDESSPRVWEDAPNLSKPRVTNMAMWTRRSGNARRWWRASSRRQCSCIIPTGDPRQYGVLDGRGGHGVGFDARHFQRARWAGGPPENPAEPGAGDLRLHGRRVRLEIRPGVEGGLAAQLSKAAKAPVRLMLPRFDEALAVGNRPSSFQKIKLGADCGRQAAGL